MIAEPAPEPETAPRLPWGIVVRTAGLYNDCDEPDPASEEPDRPVGRVVIEVPDFVADSLAQVIWAIWKLSDQLEEMPRPDRELADALHAAALQRTRTPREHEPQQPAGNGT